MDVIDGYQEATDQNHNILESKKNRGMNYPCPATECVLTFSSEKLMKKHLAEEEHTQGNDVTVESTSDRVKMSWISGLSGNVAVRKSGKKSRKLPRYRLSQFYIEQ